MTRPLLLSCSVVLMFLSGASLSQSPAIPKVAPPPPSTPSTPPVEAPPTKEAEPPRKDDLVAELIVVLNQTQAIDTFFVTLGLLDSMGPRA